MLNAKYPALKFLLAMHQFAVPAPHFVQHTKASYYNNSAYGGAGHCAHRTLPKGTVATVTGTHGTIHCVVNDRGPYISGRGIDLNINDFVVVSGSASAGVAVVTVTAR